LRVGADKYDQLLREHLTCACGIGSIGVSI
jgi:hypothetical protein